MWIHHVLEHKAILQDELVYWELPWIPNARRKHTFESLPSSFIASHFFPLLLPYHHRTTTFFYFLFSFLFHTLSLIQVFFFLFFFFDILKLTHVILSGFSSFCSCDSLLLCFDKNIWDCALQLQTLIIVVDPVRNIVVGPLSKSSSMELQPESPTVIIQSINSPNNAF